MVSLDKLVYNGYCPEGMSLARLDEVPVDLPPAQAEVAHDVLEQSRAPEK